MNYNNSEFLASYGLSRQLPDSDRPEIVFSGRSNVGKSSVGQPHTAGFGAQYGHFTASFPKIYCNTILAHPRAACNRAGFAVQ